MKTSRWFAILAFVGLILALVGFSPSTARADSLPPDPGFQLCCPVSGLDLLSPSFTFTVTAGVNGFTNPGLGTTNQFDFINSTGFTAIELDITNASGLSLSLFCVTGNSFFNNCSPQEATVTNTVRFFGIDSGHPGIQNAPVNTLTCFGDPVCTVPSNETGAAFEIDADGTGLTQNVTFTALLVAPEPSAGLLLLVGIVFLFLFRRAGWNLNFKT